MGELGGGQPRRVSASHPDMVIDTDLFKEHADAAYYISEVAAGCLVHDPALFKGSGVLRAAVYIGEKKFLGRDRLRDDGTEHDEDDARSIAIVVAQATNDAEQIVTRVTGTERLILKRHEDDLLPVERDYPEIFGDSPAPTCSAEISRLIARHPDPRVQFRVSMGVIRAGFCWLESHRPDVPVYAMMEPGFVRMLQTIELPYEQLTPFKRISEYGDTRNAAIRLSTLDVLAQTKPDQHFLGGPDMKGFFQGTHGHNGYGYFDQTLMNPVK